jgi:large subunit ribosomal protein L32
MAHPKRKISKSRRDKRRTHYKATPPSLSTCSNCGELKLSHRACPSCGYYSGRSLFVPES